jgi:hypothetical protein
MRTSELIRFGCSLALLSALPQSAARVYADDQPVVVSDKCEKENSKHCFLGKLKDKLKEDKCAKKHAPGVTVIVPEPEIIYRQPVARAAAAPAPVYVPQISYSMQPVMTMQAVPTVSYGLAAGFSQSLAVGQGLGLVPGGLGLASGLGARGLGLGLGADQDLAFLRALAQAATGKADADAAAAQGVDGAAAQGVNGGAKSIASRVDELQTRIKNLELNQTDDLARMILLIKSIDELRPTFKNDNPGFKKLVDEANKIDAAVRSKTKAKE